MKLTFLQNPQFSVNLTSFYWFYIPIYGLLPTVKFFKNLTLYKSTSSRGLILEVRSEFLILLIIASKPMDTRLNKNQVELGVFICAIGVKVLAHANGLFDEEIEILGELSCEASGLENSENLVTGNGVNLSNTVLITKDNTDLGGGHTLLGHLGNHILDLKRRRERKLEFEHLCAIQVCFTITSTFWLYTL